MERAVEFKYSSCSAVLGTQLALAGAVLLPPRVATAASVPFPSLANCRKAADTVGGMRKMLWHYHALRQQEMPDVQDDKVPLEPSDRGRFCTPRDVPADILPLPEEFKDLDKLGAPVIDHAPPPVFPVNKVVWEPMEALTQLDGAVYVRMCMYVCVCMYVYMCECMYVCVYIYIYIYIYVHVYVYGHI